MNLDAIKNELALCESQLAVFNSRGTAQSATRARSHLMNIVKACQQSRKSILDAAKAKKNKAPVAAEPTIEPVDSPLTEEEPEEEAQPIVPVKRVRKPRKPKS